MSLETRRTVTLRDMVSIAQTVIKKSPTNRTCWRQVETQVAYRHLSKEEMELTSDLSVSDLTGLKLLQLKQRVSALPQDAAVIYTSLYSDGEGTFFPPVQGLRFVAEVANRPIVIHSETFLGEGGIGGKVITTAVLGEGAAQLVLAILNGERASDIPITESEARPIFDWQQLQRWHVDAARLPSGSEIRFRPLSAWEQYSWQITFFIIALAIQSGLIIALMFEHNRRQRAEAQSLHRLNELALINRYATAGELSASLAHEIRQPLTTIATQEVLD